MNKLSVKERVNLYKQITDARKEFFKKLREHDMGEVAIQDIQLKALEPVTGKLEEVKKQAQEIYVELQEYFRLNRMDEEITEMKKIYEEIKNVNEKLAFVKQVLEDIVNKQDVDFDEAKEEAKEDVQTRERRSMEKEDIAGREDRERRSMEKEDVNVGDSKSKSEEKFEEESGTFTPTRQQDRFEKLSIPVDEEGWIKLNKRDIEGVKITALKRLLNARYPQLAQRRVKNVILNQYNKKNINELRNLLVENLSLEAMVAYGRQLSSPRKAKRVIETGEEGVAVKGEGIKRKRGRPRKKQEGSSLLMDNIARLSMMRDKFAMKQQTGKGMKKRGRPKKEDKHLVNSLVLHTGSKAAGNDNLDNDIKQIINRMHKNKMITATQKKELLEKYI